MDNFLPHIYPLLTRFIHPLHPILPQFNKPLKSQCGVVLASETKNKRQIYKNTGKSHCRKMNCIVFVFSVKYFLSSLPQVSSSSFTLSSMGFWRECFVSPCGWCYKLWTKMSHAIRIEWLIQVSSLPQVLMFNPLLHFLFTLHFTNRKPFAIKVQFI